MNFDTHLDMNSFSKFVEVLANYSYDPSEVSLKLAQKYPKIFMELIGPIDDKIDDKIDANKVFLDGCINQIIRGDHIAAIKDLRTKCNLGLKEAKDIVDRVRYHLKSIGIMFGDYAYNTILFTHQQETVYGALINRVNAKYDQD